VLLPTGFKFGERILLALRAHFGKRGILCGRARACKPIRGVGKPAFDGLTTERIGNTEEVMSEIAEIALHRLTDGINFSP
jgi:hypothetical protein